MLTQALKLAKEIYGNKCPVRPSKQQDVSKQLKKEIVRKCKDVEFVGMFNSCKVFDSTFDYDSELKITINVF
jgi:hypothetical protein